MLGGVPSRFIAPDRGEAIPYLIDVDTNSLPAGITLTQATNAVQQALTAWTAVTSLKFKFAGIQSFGQGADTIQNQLDGALRIQLHDNYNSITDPNVLGIGGRGAYSSALSTGWDLGGNVAGNEFEQTKYGYVVLKSSHSAMQVLSTFTEVLCHEIGHSINMAHSSEVTTSDPVLLNAIMYFQAHADGRGATLGSYDPPVIQQIYPIANTPPYTFDRVMDITSASTAPNVAGINEVQLRGYDLQTANLTFAVTDQTAINGAFSQVSSTIKYTPNNVGTAPRLDPADSMYYDAIFARFSDGTNASPYLSVRVLSYNRDTKPTTSDGIPDNWMIKYFLNADPTVGSNHRATNDFDGDGLNNLNEYRSGMVPTNSLSAQRITLVNGTTLQWQAMPYELYEILGTTNLADSNAWTRVGVVLPTDTNTSLGTFNYSAAAPAQFFRILKVP